MMTILFIILCGFLGVITGRIVFARWFNHVSLYSGIWCFSLSLFELRLINYYPLETETWIIIFSGWASFVLGSLTIVAARWSVNTSVLNSANSSHVNTSSDFQKEVIILERILWVLIIIASLAALHTWYILINLFGSISNVLTRGAILYSLSVSQEIKGTIPYVSSLCLTATLLGGVHAAKVGKLKLVSILPVIICIIVNFSNMGRALMIMAAVIFSCGYFLMKSNQKIESKIKQPSKVKQLMMALFVLGLLVFASEMVRSTRHIDENVVGAKKALKSLEGASFITPTIYLYLTVHHGVFNQYLKHEVKEGFLGANTFAPILRVLDKFGFDTYVEQKQIGYMTPTWANTGTYLREIHSDFGLWGILLFPFFLGYITTYFWFSFMKTRKYVHLAALTYLQVMTTMGLFYLVTLAGYLLVYLLGALIVGVFLDFYVGRISLQKENYA